MKHDATFDPDSHFGTEKWCAMTLGRSADWLVKNIAALERDGFPRKDPLIGLRSKHDVLEWIAKRRKFSHTQGSGSPTTAAGKHHDTTNQYPGENLARL